MNLINNLILVAVLAASAGVQAEENGFTFEDSIRHQVFLELKSNVENLYESGQLLVPEIDPSEVSRVVSNQQGGGFVLPVNGQIDNNDAGSPASFN